MKELAENSPIEKILTEKLGIPNLIDILGETPLYKLTPILIEGAKRRAASITPQELLRIYDSKLDFYGVSSFEQREIVEFQNNFYSVLPETFESVEVSPICPLGTNSVITNLSQNKIMSTTRGSEVVGDPTTCLILECASRRKKFAKKEETLFKRVDLGTFQRVVRMQPFDKSKGYMQHFNLLGIATAARENKYYDFVSKVMLEHLTIWIDFIDHLNNNGYTFENISVNISNTKILEAIIENASLPREMIALNSNNEDFDFLKHFNIDIPNEVSSMYEISPETIEEFGIEKIVSQMLLFEKDVLNVLQEKYPNVNFCFDFNRVAGIGYYKDYCLHIYATNKSGRRVQLSDGGSVDYIEKLLSDKKEYAITSGFGAELIQKLFMDKER